MAVFHILSIHFNWSRTKYRSAFHARPLRKYHLSNMAAKKLVVDNGASLIKIGFNDLETPR